MKFIFVFLFVSLGAMAKAPSADVMQKILLPLKTCPEKIWPGYNPLKEADYIINVPSENKSFIIGSDGFIQEKTAEIWGEEGLSPYAFGEKDGRKYVIVNFEDSPDEEQAMQTFFHEGFHFLGQKGIKASTDRDELFPVDYDARIARAMQLRNMRKYLAEKKSDHLQKAAYWERWIKENRPEEFKANQDWDVLEGSAEFVGLMSSAVSHLGCEASDEELMKKILEISSSDIDTSDRSGQSYSAGLMGYMLSRLNQTNDVFTKLNQSPLSVALTDCPETEDSPDAGLKEEFSVQFHVIEEAVSQAVDELDTSSGLVAIPAKAIVGAFEAMGFYSTHVQGSKAMVIPQTSMRIAVNGQSLQIKDKNLWDSRLRQKMCGSYDEFFLIPKESVPELTNLTEDGTYLGKTLYCAEPMNP